MSKIEKVNNLLKKLQETFESGDDFVLQDIADELVFAFVSLLGLDDVKPSELLHLPRVESERSRFEKAPGFKNRPAAFELKHNGKLPIDLKMYWLKKATKTNMSWVMALTPNYEDNPSTMSNRNIGIDFVLNKEHKAFYIILSSNFKLRVMELHDALTHTQREIFQKWESFHAEKYSDPTELKNELHSLLWGSFDFEPINKKFFITLAEEHFIPLVEHLNKIQIGENDAQRKLFATRLFGRIIFLWFLRKKDFLNPNIGYFSTTDFKDDTEYYRKRLEPLFFEVLNKEIKDRTFEDKETPFLNGGLFNNTEEDFYKNNNLIFPDNFFTNLFKFLNHYNFTVDEGTSEYQQVAIDPEMLGRVFENLLAMFVTETGEKARKEKGAFYTPREIVDYMCKESLLTFLTNKFGKSEESKKRLYELVTMPESEFRDQDHNKRRDFKKDLPTDELLQTLKDELKILDPAVGSGAFPIGMMHLLVKIISRLDAKVEKDIAKLKRDILSKNIYGVDIDNMAIQIARLRAWLSILVDMKNKKHIKPLPNLEFKFVCANTLIPLESANEQDNGLFDDPEFKEKQLAIIGSYYEATTKRQKEKLQRDYKKLISLGDKNGSTSQMVIGETSYLQKLRSYDPFNPANSTQFYDPELMHGIKTGFDIVIGNPPYVSLEKVKENKDEYKKIYEVFAPRGDLYTLFYERGLNLTKEGGYLIYITSNKWMRAGYGEKLRGYFAKKNPLVLIDFGGFKVFESATVDTNILLIQNAENQNHLEACHFKNDYKRGESIAEYFEKNKVTLQNLSSDIWFIGTREEIALKEKIEKIGTPLKEWDVNIYRGVLTGFNEAFIIDKETKEKLIAEDPKSAEIIKPLLRGRDIKRYGYEFAEKYLINTHNGYTDENGNKIPPINVENYPAIKKWLDQFYDKLAKRQDKGNTPYNLRDCAYLQEFEKEKVVYSEIVREPQFYYDENKFFVEATAFIMTGERVKMLTGVFNSKLFTFIFKTFYAGGGLGEDGYRYKKKFIEKVPIPKITPENKYIAEQIEKLVDQIQKAKKQNPSADTSQLESQIDELVFELYNLSEEKIVS